MSHGTVVSPPLAGTSPQNPVWLAPVAWVYLGASSVGLSTIDPCTYDNGTAGVGATLTQNTPGDGQLTIDGGSPVPGDRVLIDNWEGEYAGQIISGIYTVTAVGDGATVPWVLTRATDNDTEATLLQFWAVRVVGTGVLFYTGSQAIAWPTTPGPVGTGELEMTLQAFAATAIGQDTIAAGVASLAPSANCVASGQDSASLVGGGVASGAFSVNVTGGGLAYGDGQVVDGQAGAFAQHSSVVAARQTADAAETALHNALGQACLIRFVWADGTPWWLRTARVRLSVTGRDSGTPGTAGVWTAEGAIDGDGSSAYRWVGGSAPTFTPAAYNDAGTVTWGLPAVSIGTDPLPSSAAALIGTVTGKALTSISWECTLELDEVSG